MLEEGEEGEEEEEESDVVRELLSTHSECGWECEEFFFKN